MSLILNPNANNTVNITLGGAMYVATQIASKCIPQILNFPNQKNSITNALPKINQMLFTLSEVTPRYSWFPVGIFDKGQSNEILTPDTPAPILSLTLMSKLMQNAYSYQNSWRLAQYTEPYPLVAVPGFMSFYANEFNKYVQNYNQLNTILGIKMLQFTKAVILHWNARLREGILMPVKKALKNLLPENVPAFQASTAYNIYNNAVTHDDILNNYKLPYTYLKGNLNINGTQVETVGVVFNNITAERGLLTFQEAVDKGFIRPLHIIVQLPRPGTGANAQEKHENNEKFIKELQNLDYYMQTEMLEENAFNGADLGNNLYNKFTIVLDSHVITELGIEEAGIIHLDKVGINFFARAEKWFKIFDRNEIYNDENTHDEFVTILQRVNENEAYYEVQYDEDTHEAKTESKSAWQLGLKRVWGFIGDYSTFSEAPLSKIYLDNTIPGQTNGVKSVDIDPKMPVEIAHIYQKMITRYQLNASKFIMVFVDPLPSNKKINIKKGIK